MGDGAERFFSVVDELLRKLRETQLDAIARAACVVSDRLATGGTLFTFGSGHSHSIAVEAFARAGGLRPVQVISSGALTLGEGPGRAGRVERLAGYAACVLADHNLDSGDVLLIASNSGVNAAVVEAALYARERAVPVIAVTSITHSRSEVPKHPSGKRLMDLADVVLDNCGIHGDAAVALPGLARRVGPTSTLAGAILVNALMVQVTMNLARLGIDPPLLESGNVSPVRAPAEPVADSQAGVAGPARGRH